MVRVRPSASRTTASGVSEKAAIPTVTRLVTPARHERIRHRFPGSPRWLIYFSDGNHAFGYPSNAPAGTGNMWGVNNGTPGSYAALVVAESAATVTEVDIVMDADQAPPSTSTISCINYNGSLLGTGTCS